MASTVYEGKECRYGVADQAVSGVFGTAVADNENFIEVSIEDTDFSSRGLMTYDVPGVHGCKNPTQENMVVTGVGAMPIFPVTGPVNLNVVDHYLYAHFQKVTEGAASPFTKTFTHFTVQPDFPNDAGHWLTWCRDFPGTDTAHKVHSCIAKSLKLSAARDEMFIIENEWCGKTSGEIDAEPTGSWDVTPVSQILYFNDIDTATLDTGAGALAVNLESFEISVGYEVEKVGQDVSGYENFGTHSRAGSFTVSLMKDARVEEALAARSDAEFCTFVVTWTDKMTITVTGKIEDMSMDADGILGATLNCRMLAADTDADMLTVVVQNSIDRGWPAA